MEHISNELIIFGITLATGMVIGFVFDIFRIFRKIFKHPDFLVIIQDSIFCFFTCIYTFYLTYILNSGQIRIYILLGIIISNIVYFLTLSRAIISSVMLVFRQINMFIIKIRQKGAQFFKNT